MGRWGEAMKAIQFNASVPRYAFTMAAGRLKREAYYRGPASTTRLVDIPEPELVNENWVKVRTTYGGVCGSDINLMFLRDTPYTEPYTTMPFTIGHENVGRVAEVGSNVEGFSAGDRVVMDPMLSCAARDIEPPCEPCGRGDYSQCQNMREGSLSPGFYAGFCGPCGGSWSEYFVAHKSQLVKVPDSITDEEALLFEAFTVPLHSVMRNLPAPGETALVYGCGAIGMLAVASLKALAPECRVIVIARYPFQAEVARGYGAEEIIMQRDVDDLYAEVARLTGAQVLKPMIGDRYLNGGPDVVLDCVGSRDTLDDSLRMTTSGGRVVLIGLVNFAKGLDWTPIWFNELSVSGSLCSASDSYQGRTMKTFEWARDLIAGGKVRVEHLLTHVWKLDEYVEMIETATSKGGTGCIKQAFRF
jgi:threonine dehydrogenase-like Zn-dependent dehydrogenase